MLITKITATPKARFLVRSLITLGFWSGVIIPASADITTGGNGTVVSPAPGAQTNTIDISGGTPSGTNLFHSFGTFNLTSTQVANFQTDASVQNILGRINGGQPSSIDGKIQVTGAANLFLMNPAGIIFGPNASLNVNGAFTATTANAIGFGNDRWFNALGTNNYNALTGTPDGLAFTNSPGSIFNAANLTTQAGKSITLVGGTVISTGNITTSGGNISIATVQAGQYVQIKSDGSILSLNLPTGNGIASEAKAFTAPSLPILLTGSDGKTVRTEAVGVTVENGIVKLVGDTRSIASGDIVTKNLNTSNNSQNGNGGTVVLKAQTSINAGIINSQSTENADNQETKGGNVNLETKTGNIIVQTIDTSSRNTGKGGTGGNLTIISAGLFQALGKGIFLCQECSIFTGGNANNNVTPAIDDQTTLGTISITHGGSSFVTGVTTQIDPNGSNIPVIFTPLPNFSFPADASGTVGAIASFNTNGKAAIVRTEGGFSSSNNLSISEGFSIKSVPPQANSNNSETQIAKQKSGVLCNSGSPESTTSTAGSQNTSAADPCQPISNNGKILQIRK